MANQPFDREIINGLERPVSGDVNTGWSEQDQEVRALLEQQTLTRTDSTIPDAPTHADGFIGGGFKVRPNPAGADGNVYLSAGLGWQYLPGDVPVNINGVQGLNDVAPLKPLVLSGTGITAATGITVPAAPAGGSSRIDIIEVRTNRVVSAPSSRDVLNPATGAFNPTTVNKNIGFTLNDAAQICNPGDPATDAIVYRKGTAAVTVDPTVPTVPSTDSGYMKIAEIFVLGGSTTYDASVIRDLRPLIFNNGMVEVSCFVEFENAGGQYRILMGDIIAPPGIVVTGYATSTSLGYIYIVANLDNGAGIVQNAQTTTSTFTNAQPCVQILPVDAAGGHLLTSAEQTGLLSAAAVPAVSVAVNQPTFRFQVQVSDDAFAASALGSGNNVRAYLRFAFQRTL